MPLIETVVVFVVCIGKREESMSVFILMCQETKEKNIVSKIVNRKREKKQRSVIENDRLYEF
jgi:Trk K+ transport system NAD-binding subunit